MFALILFQFEQKSYFHIPDSSAIQKSTRERKPRIKLSNRVVVCCISYWAEQSYGHTIRYSIFKELYQTTLSVSGVGDD